MSDNESCVVRIVDVDESFTKQTLKELITTRCQPRGDIKRIYLQRQDLLKLSYAYVVFQYSYDAVKVTQILNGNVYATKRFQAEMIGPKLQYKKFTVHGMINSGLNWNDGSVVHITNLGCDTEREDMNALLEPYDYEKYILQKDMSNLRLRLLTRLNTLKMAYVQFATRELAVAAVDQLKGAVCKGGVIQASLFRS